MPYYPFLRPMLCLHCTLIGLFVAATALHGQVLHRYDRAIEAFAESGPLDSLLHYVQLESRAAQQTDSLQHWAKTHLMVQVFLGSQHKQQAITYAETLARARWRNPRTAAEWRAWLNIEGRRAYDLKEQSKIVQAISVIEPLLPIAEQYQMNDLLDDFLYKFGGNLYTRLGDNEKALAIFEKALKISSDPEVLAGHYLNIGLAYWNQGELAASAKAFESGLQQPNLSPTRQAQLWSGLAQTELEQGRYQSVMLQHAAYHCSAALRTYPPDDIRRSDTWLTATLVALEQNNIKQAYQYLNQAEKITQKANRAPRDRGKLLIARSRWHFAAGQYESALSAANAALQVLLPQFQPKTVFDQPDPATFFQENTLFEALQIKAMAAEAMGRDKRFLELALQCHDLAWQAEVTLREALIYQSAKLKLQNDSRLREEAAIRVARRLYEISPDLRYAQKALQVAERSKANLLLDALQENLIRQNLAATDPRFDQINALRHNMAAIESKILTTSDAATLAELRISLNDLKSEATSIERQLNAQFPRLSLSDFFSSTNHTPLNYALHTNETGLVYFMAEKTLHIFVVDAQGIKDWQQKVLNGEIEAFLHWFKDEGAIINTPSEYYQSAWVLGQLLIPATACGATRLMIVPDGSVCLVPFEALLTAPAEEASLRKAPYWIRQATISYAFSLATLARQKAYTQRSNRDFLGMAPLFSQQERGLAPLLAGANEWQQWPNVVAKVGYAADAQQFLSAAGAYRIVHLSTHVSAGLQPHIEWFDRAMYLPEIYALPLRADLVVLSACETGLGQSERSEGLMSLSRAFAQAGAACIISSLWQVNDRSTARLFGHFYTALRQRNSIATALQQAQLAYLADQEVNAAFQSPYFWAGFVPVGADKIVESKSWNWTFFFAISVALIAISWGLYRRVSARSAAQKDTN
jgi:CHAT domain-containing protein